MNKNKYKFIDKVDKKEAFTKIPNYLIENIVKTKLSGSELIVFLIICRQTFGFQKVSDPLAGSRIARFSYFPTPYVFRVLKKLENKGLILITRSSRGCINVISISTDISSWTVDRRKTKANISEDTTYNIPAETFPNNPPDIHKRKIDKETRERNIALLRQKMIELGLKK